LTGKDIGFYLVIYDKQNINICEYKARSYSRTSSKAQS